MPNVLTDGSSAIRLRHDFGIVPPNQELKHRFGIHNSSGVDWTLRQIVNGCGCTAVELSAPPVSAIPGQVFFGKAAVGETVKGRITLAFAPDAIPGSPKDVVVEHGLGDQLRVFWSKSEGEFWELDAELTPRRASGMTGAKLTIRFADPGLPRLDLPIYVLLDPR